MYDYTCRRKPGNMLLAGFWFGTEHPVFNSFMAPIASTLKTMHREEWLVG